MSKEQFMYMSCHAWWDVGEKWSYYNTTVIEYDYYEDTRGNTTDGAVACVTTDNVIIAR